VNDGVYVNGYENGFSFSAHKDWKFFSPDENLYSSISPFSNPLVQAYGSHRFPHRAVMNLTHGNRVIPVIVNEVTEFGIFEIAALFVNKSLRYQRIVVDKNSFSMTGNAKQYLLRFCSEFCSKIFDDINVSRIDNPEQAKSQGYEMDKPPTLLMPRTKIPFVSNSKRSSDEDFTPFFKFHNESNDAVHFISRFSKDSFEDPKQSNSMMFLRYLACFLKVPIVICHYKLSESKLFCSDIFPIVLESLEDPTRINPNAELPDKCLFVLQTTNVSDTRFHCLFELEGAVFSNAQACEIPAFLADFAHNPSEAFEKELEALTQKFNQEELEHRIQQEKEKMEEVDKKKQDEEEKRLAKKNMRWRRNLRSRKRRCSKTSKILIGL